MKVHIKSWMAAAHWRWKVGNDDENGDNNNTNNDEDDVCGICRIPFEGCCPECKTPGDDCPLSKYTVLNDGRIVEYCLSINPFS